MSFDLEDEILQDFLVEAAEIAEQLGEQLVDLEQHVGDAELLNAIFRGFHTIKGGAGFLEIDPLAGNLMKHPDYPVIYERIEKKFWDRHDNIKSGLLDKGLI